MNEEQMKLLQPLLDSDILVYRCGFAADSQVKRDNLDPDSDYVHMAIGNTKEIINKVATMFDGSKMRLFLTGSGNFREQIATILPYKGNRDPNHKPKYHKEIKQYLLDHWGAELIHGREADDALSCAQWAAKDKSTVLCTIDKDLDMCPGHHYNFVKNEYYYVTKEWADTRLFHQMLTGDRTDNIPGITGIGPKKADKIFEEVRGDRDRFKEEVKKLYRKQYGSGWEQAYREVALLLYMQREEGQECPFI